jgi:hypothetical protein
MMEKVQKPSSFVNFSYSFPSRNIIALRQSVKEALTIIDCNETKNLRGNLDYCMKCWKDSFQNQFSETQLQLNLHVIFI